MQALRGLSLVFLMALLAAMPGAVSLHANTVAPAWYTALVLVASAIGVGSFALMFGAVAFFSLRSSARRVWISAGVAVFVGLLSSGAVIGAR